jgi:CRP/FNR family transcriptional regulator, cyclic AMP receptor protein
VACDPQILRPVPFFALLDDEELAVLAAQVDLTRFTPRQRIYRIGDPGGRAYVLVSGGVRVTTVDEDQQDVIVDEPASGEFFGFASMLDQSPHQTSAVALADTVCVEVDRDDIETLIQRRPHSAMDMLSVLGRQIHAAQQLVRIRAARNPNEIIEEQATFGERVADGVAAFGGSWTFIITFLSGLAVYAAINVVLGRRAWDPYPFILLNLMLSMLAALQAPVIMMSQIRQDTKDRLRGELDFAVNRRAEAEVQELSRKLNAVIDKIDDLDEGVRRRLG